MGRSRRALILTLTALVGGGPVLAQATADPAELARRLTASPQEIANILAGKAGAAPLPIETFETPPAPLALAPESVTPPAARAPSVVTVASGPRAVDQVDTVVVRAPSGEDELPGPAWWKVEGPGAVVWIMGTPDLMPLATQFDQRALQKHMVGARLLIIPGSPGAKVANKPPATPALPRTPLSQRLSPQLYARLSDRLGMNEVRAKAQREDFLARPGTSKLPRQALPLMMPLEYSPTYAVTIRLVKPLVLPGNMGNPARDAAKSLAARQPMTFVDDVGFSAASFTSFRTTIDIPEDLQEACMSKMLDFLDSGQSPATLDADVKSWAIGDVTHALKHYDPLAGCDYGPVAGNFWGRLTTDYVTSLRAALAKPGQAVAIVEFDPLLASGGVLDQLRAAGFTITPPASL